MFEKYYEAHKRDWEKEIASCGNRLQGTNDTVDFWRHQRMHNTLMPVIEACPSCNWLTVGDGRGTDANFLIRNGCAALASDIGTAFLEKMKERGFVRDYREENAEALSFKDDAFDFVLCKEAYHHFPRPMVAMYEMLRVSKYDIVLIEPNDQDANYRLVSHFLRWVRKTIRNRRCSRNTSWAVPSFEPVGNYVYTVSKREFEKFGIASECYALAFKGINDAYMPGLTNVAPSVTSLKFLRVHARISLRNIFARLGIVDYGLLSLFLFKKNPGEQCMQKLLASGFKIVYLPRNPYIPVEEKNDEQ